MRFESPPAPAAVAPERRFRAPQRRTVQLGHGARPRRVLCGGASFTQVRRTADGRGGEEELKCRAQEDRGRYEPAPEPVGGACPEPVEGACPEPVEGACPEPVEGVREDSGAE